MINTLKLVLTDHWFEEIKFGRKMHEYRKATPFWYRRLLERQANLINRMKADILNHAQMTYFDVVNNKNKFLISISCDYKKLEKACKTYNKDYKPCKKDTTKEE